MLVVVLAVMWIGVVGVIWRFCRASSMIRLANVGGVEVVTRSFPMSRSEFKKSASSGLIVFAVVVVVVKVGVEKLFSRSSRFCWEIVTGGALVVVVVGVGVVVVVVVDVVVDDFCC